MHEDSVVKIAPSFWPEAKSCAVSLTYDDALDSHWREVAPALERRGFRGTFYTLIRASLWDHVSEWRRIAQAGHELGNHTVFHPCRRSPENASYANFDRDDLSRYTLDEFQRELEVANAFLRMIDGRDQRTYGNTCHHTTVGRQEDEVSIAPMLRKLFPAARGFRRADFTASDPQNLHLHEIGCVSSYSASDFQKGIDHALETGGWLIICLHGVAEVEERLRIARREHEALLDYLAETSSVWVAPVIEVATRLLAHRPTSTPPSAHAFA